MGNRITHIQFYFQPVTKTSKDREQAGHDLRTLHGKLEVSARLRKFNALARKQSNPNKMSQ